MLERDRYTYRVSWSAEDGEHVGTCVEFPGLSWLAESPEEALQGIRQVVADAVADMKEQGEAVPQPIADRPFSGKILLRTTPDMHRELFLRAAENRVSLNRFLNSKLTS